MDDESSKDQDYAYVRIRLDPVRGVKADVGWEISEEVDEQIYEHMVAIVYGLMAAIQMDLKSVVIAGNAFRAGIDAAMSGAAADFIDSDDEDSDDDEDSSEKITRH
jgi:hypothetical protein